ncbi:hypothetical protein CVT25_014967 [Psilocybe cyanescens]|uniref:Ras modification protein ERF4 n=1 Tax=Psilocybe cyanescens TaxID=93625 RepID=A0A409XI71_PSICY|nr:hypothetical protein CVT25_014967 [Psilocybe cyanescens]
MPEAMLANRSPFSLPNPDPNMNMNMMADGHRDTGDTTATGSLAAASNSITTTTPTPTSPQDNLQSLSPFSGSTTTTTAAPPARGTPPTVEGEASHDSGSARLVLDSAPSSVAVIVKDTLNAESGNCDSKKKALEDMEGMSMQDLKTHTALHAGASTESGGEVEAGVESREVAQGGEDVDVGSTTLAERTLVEGTEEEPRTTRTHVKGLSSSSLSLPPPTAGLGSGSRTHAHAPTQSVDSSRRYRHWEAEAGGSAAGHSHSYSEEQPRTATTLVTWDPLKGTDDGHADGEAEGPGRKVRRDGTQDDTVVVEDDGQDVVDSKGKLLFPDDDEEEPGAHGFPPGSAGAPISAVARRASHLRLDLKPAPASPLPWEQVDPPPDNNSKSIAGYYSPVSSQKFRTLQNSGGPRPLIPKSSYYFGPPAPDSAYGTPPVGQIGVHHPREILRVERDYTGGELIQFAPIYPLELEGRITPTHFLESINAINELLISAHSLRHSLVDNALAIFSLQISKLFVQSHFEKASAEMIRLRALIDDLNTELYNPVGLNILWPQNVAFLYLEIEYYVSVSFILLVTLSSLISFSYSECVVSVFVLFGIFVPMDRATFLGVEALGNQGRGL